MSTGEAITLLGAVAPLKCWLSSKYPTSWNEASDKDEYGRDAFLQGFRGAEHSSGEESPGDAWLWTTDARDPLGTCTSLWGPAVSTGKEAISATPWLSCPLFCSAPASDSPELHSQCLW